MFAANGGYVVALTYGADSEWVKNVLAAGVVRAALRVLRVSDFLRLDEPAR